jgi:WD40 repeat protein
MAEQGSHTHDAFISYSRKDAAFARALERALERFKPPRDLEMPSRHLDIFRDEEDFTGTDYKNAIRGHLKRSRKLIVVCSQAARASAYVDEEIRLFVEAVGAAHVIPVLLSGIPSNEVKPGQEAELAFPQALCEVMEMPLAAPYSGFDPAVHKPNRGIYEGAWFTLLANLYDISRSDVEQRDKHRQARLRRRWVIGGGIVIVSLMGLTGWALLSRATADTQRKRAEQAEQDATRQRDLAVESQKEAEKAADREREARAKAEEAQGSAERAAVAERAARAEEQRQRSVAESRQLSAQASLPRNRERNEIERGVLLALESMLRYPTGEAARSVYAGLAVLPRHVATFVPAGRVDKLAFSSDGRYVVTAGTDNTAAVFEIATSRIQTLLSHVASREAGAVDMSRDGRFLAAYVPGEGLRLVEAASGQLRGHVPATDKLDRLQFSGDGSRLLGGSNHQGDRAAFTHSVRIWDTESLAEIGRLEGAGFLDALMLTTDGKRLITSVGDAVRIHDMPTLRLVRTISQGQDGLSPSAVTLGAPVAAISLGGERLALAHGNRVAIVKWATQEPFTEIATEPGASAFSPDGNLLAVNHRLSLDLWDTTTGRQVAAVAHDREGIDAFDFSANGKRLATASRRGTARVWDVSNGRELARVLHDPDSGSDAVAFSPDGTRLASASQESVRIIEILPGGELSRTAAPLGLTRPPALNGTSAGLRVATVQQDSVRLIDAVTGNALAVRRHDENAESARTLAIGPDGRSFASAASEYWMYARGKPTARVWRTDASDAAARMEMEAVVNVIDFSLDGRYVAAGGRNGLAYVWESNGRETARLLTGEEIHGIAVSPGARLLATTGGDVNRQGVTGRDALRIWDVQSARLLRSVRHDANVYAVTFSHDGRRLAAAGGDRTARVYDAWQGTELARLFHDSVINALALSPDAAYLATANQDGTTRIWEIAGMREVARIEHEAPVWAVAFDWDGRRVATISGRRNDVVKDLHTWIWRTADLASELCARVTRNLTQAEWREYFSDRDPYRATCPNLPAGRAIVPPNDRSEP